MSWNCIYGGCRRGLFGRSLLYCSWHNPGTYLPTAQPPQQAAPIRAAQAQPTGSPEYEALKARNLAEIREKRG